MKKIFNKLNQEKWNILFIVIITSAFCFTYFGNDIYYGKGHDLTFHLYRLVGIKEAFQDRHFIPRIYPYANYGFGYATPLFYCDLFLYPFSVLYYLGLPLVISYKIMIIFYSLLTSFNIFYVLKKIFKNRITYYVGTLLYIFCSYHIYDTLVREALGEVFAICFIPIILYSFYKLFIKKEDDWVLISVSFSLLLYSHLISTVLYAFVFVIYIITFIVLNKNNKEAIKKMIKTVIKATLLALVLTIWYWLPLFEQLFDQTFIATNLSKIYDLKNGVVPLSSIFSILCHLDVEKNGLQFINIVNIGMPLIVGSILYLFSKKNTYITLSLIICVIFLGATHGIIPVYLMKSLSFLQFLFRLYIVVFPLLTLCCSYMLDNLNNKKITYCFTAFVIAFSILNILNINMEILYSENKLFNTDTRETIFEYSSDYRDYNEKELSGAEYLPSTEIVNYQEESPYIKQINKDGQYCDLIYTFDRNFTNINFKYNFDSNIELMLPLTYYKGYKVFEIVDNDKREIECYPLDRYKQVGFTSEIGEHEYLCHYEGTAIQEMSVLISLIASILTIINTFKHKYIK